MRFLNWLLDRLIAFDIWVSERWNGLPGETLSARCWRLRDFQPYQTLRPILDWAFQIWGNNHCEMSFNKHLLKQVLTERGQ